LVKQASGNSEKWVERLSLLFDFEDKNLFKQRVQVSKEYQGRAEDEIRFQNYAEKVPDNLVSSLEESTIENIKNKQLILGKRYREEEMNWANQISAKIIKTVKAEYTREMKKQFVVNEMKDLSTHPKFDDLRIKIRHKTNHIKFYATIDKLDYEDTNFGVLAKKLKLNHSTREPKLVEAL
jgi:dynein heavy chain